MPPIQFKDTLTGKILTFDHEPSQAELNAASSTGNIMPPQREGGTGGVAPGLGGIAGALIGGKTPLGKIGAGIGAAAGTAYGDLYDMFTGGAVPTPMDEANRLATVGGMTSGLEMGLPPVLRAAGAIKKALPTGTGLGGGGLLGYMFGHPAAGAAVGAAMDVAPKIADGIDWLGTPYKPSAPAAAAGPSYTPAELASMAKKGITPEMLTGGRKPIPAPAPKADAGPSLFNRLKSTASSAMEGLGNYFHTPTPPEAPPAPPSPYVPRGVEVPYRISEDMLPDASHVKAPSGGQEGMVYPNMTREPNLKYGADVSAAPQSPVKGPNLTQTSPTDPEMPWQDYNNTTAPRRSSAKAFGGVDVSTPLDALKQAAPAPAVEPPAAVGTHDDFLQRWLEAGGTPESYAASQARGGLQSKGPVTPPPPTLDPRAQAIRDQTHPYGPNTVGAAQKPTFLPKTIDEAEGLSLPEQEAWNAFKRTNPGTSDSMLNSWYTSHQLGGDPNEGLDLQDKIDKLLSIVTAKKP